jgi:CSN8/PSMD8/EIF3K family
LVANEPYELSTLSALEKYVTVQLNEKEYDFEANKALLRSYQINAEHVKLDVVVNTMILSLMRLPSTDFLALSYIIPGKLPLQPKLKQVQKFADLLERAEFGKFWEEYSAPDQTLTSAAVGFADFIRTFIMNNTRDTFRNISKELLQQFLALSSSEIDAFCKSSPFVESVSANLKFVECCIGSYLKFHVWTNIFSLNLGDW